MTEEDFPVKWPDMPPCAKSRTDGFRPLSFFVKAAFESFEIACELEPKCESPIEIDLGVSLTKVFQEISDPKLSLEPQFILGPFRDDFAIRCEGLERPIALVECDGKEFHSTEDQIRRELAKERLAIQAGFQFFRFSGSHIYRNPKKCVRQILERFGFRNSFESEDEIDITLELADQDA